MGSSQYRSFSDPDTEFELVRSDTPVSVDGYKIGEPTGEVECEECGARAKNVDEVPHEPHCSQRFTLSEWWAEQILDQ